MMRRTQLAAQQAAVTVAPANHSMWSSALRPQGVSRGRPSDALHASQRMQAMLQNPSSRVVRGVLQVANVWLTWRVFVVMAPKSIMAKLGWLA